MSSPTVCMYVYTSPLTKKFLSVPMKTGGAPPCPDLRKQLCPTLIFLAVRSGLVGDARCKIFSPCAHAHTHIYVQHYCIYRLYSTAPSFLSINKITYLSGRAGARSRGRSHGRRRGRAAGGNTGVRTCSGRGNTCVQSEKCVLKNF